MKEENKTKEELEELCCVNKNICSIDCVPIKKKNSESKCKCEGCC